MEMEMFPFCGKYFGVQIDLNSENGLQVRKVIQIS